MKTTFHKLLARGIISKEPDLSFEEDECELYVIGKQYHLITANDPTDIVDSIQINTDGSVIVQHLGQWSEAFKSKECDLDVEVFKKVNLMQ